MTDLNTPLSQATEFYHRFWDCAPPPKGSQEEQYAIRTLAAYIEEGVKNSTGVAVGETPTVHRMAEVLDYITAYDAFNVDTPDGAVTDLSSPMNAHRRLLMHVFVEAMAARELIVCEAGPDGGQRQIEVRDLVLEGDDRPRFEVQIAPPSDTQMRQMTERMDPDFWRDRHVATIDRMAEAPTDDPLWQEVLADARVFMALTYQPDMEAPDGNEE